MSSVKEWIFVYLSDRLGQEEDGKEDGFDGDKWKTAVSPERCLVKRSQMLHMR